MPMALKDKQTEKNKHFITSLEFAIQGIRTVFKEERNMRTHVLMGVLAIIAGFLFGLHTMEWLWLLFVIFLVLIVEIINTAFENVVDMCTDFHFHPIGKKIKDMAAGAVLITACFSVIVGCIIFLPKVWQLVEEYILMK
ncbi:diacylglycerol kinase family protein [Enterococcus sp. BWR-S5]|uniref:diacylglycerol kinase family protein n=1 Tax=Enterococcus sp. BWR-S5 TaxID=2787714 RepID=UPI001920AABF|nr:diacylglycerol kinase family protein [Enterococcus sp. BWR-S5]